jgi:L-ascorbate metabolism protein UlaG (beta-lactamase superfamily)
MKIEYISHACMLIDTGDLKIVTDPWWAEPAYCGQWYVFPKPIRTDFVNQTDVILFSHGHEDHLNEPTLQHFPKSAKVFYPYSFFGGAKEYIESMGFADVKEAVTLRKYKLSDKTSVTFIINSHDSLMIIESDGKVLVNANDALHSYPVKVIDFYLDLIKEKFGKVDILFCGFGGASYFPNTMHLKGKDDFDIALVREQLFAHNFCRVTKALNPKIAVPFAADLCLLSEHQNWINEARFPRRKMNEYFQTYFADANSRTKIVDMYSGDVIENEEVKELSPYRQNFKNGELNHLIAEQYPTELAEKKNQTFIDEAEAEKIIAELSANVEKRMTLFSKEKLRNLSFSVKLKDVAENNFYNISFKNDNFKVVRSDKSEENSLLTMEMSSEVLRYSIGSDWGADVICIGYGAEIFIEDEKLAEVDLESVCMNLLACYPTASDLKKTPFRTLQFLLLNPPKFTTSIRKLRKFSHESEIYDRKTWLLKNSDEIRKIYDMPKLERTFFQ